MKGYQIWIDDLYIVSKEVNDMICSVDELTFIDQEWYSEMLARKGLVDNRGRFIKSHPQYISCSPVVSRTRNKEKKNTILTCEFCHSKYKSEKSLQKHLMAKHQFMDN